MKFENDIIIDGKVIVKDKTATDILLGDGSTTPIDKNITVRRVLIPTTALPANFTSTDVKNWLNTNEGIGDSEVLFWETTADTVVVALSVNIITPTEGQSITGDVNITFELFNNTGVNILTPTEGQEITGDVNITFEIL